jgi:hypothetical protein
VKTYYSIEDPFTCKEIYKFFTSSSSSFVPDVGDYIEYPKGTFEDWYRAKVIRRIYDSFHDTVFIKCSAISMSFKKGKLDEPCTTTGN